MFSKMSVFGTSVFATGVMVGLQMLTRLEDAEESDKESVNYSEFREAVKTGDILLSSSTELNSVTRWVTGSPWSHCGLAYVDPKDGKIYEWSAHCEEEGLISRKGGCYGGAQLIEVNQLIATSGSLFWRPIDSSKSNRRKISRVIEAWDKTPSCFPSYGEFVIDFMMMGSKSCYGKLVCSQVVAATLASCDVIELTGKKLHKCVPMDFSEEGNSVSWNRTPSNTRCIVGCDSSQLVDLP